MSAVISLVGVHTQCIHLEVATHGDQNTWMYIYQDSYSIFTQGCGSTKCTPHEPRVYFPVSCFLPIVTQVSILQISHTHRPQIT